MSKQSLAKRSRSVEIAGKKAKQRRTLRTVFYAIGQGIFGGMLTLGKLGLVSLVKYVVSAASIPFEIINLVAEVDTLVEKQSAPSKILFVIMLGLGSVAFLAIVDAVKWGGYQVGFLASVAAAVPYVFTALLGTMTVLSTVGLIKKAIFLYKNPDYRTPLKKIGLTHKAIKTVGLAILTVAVALFSIAFVATPIGATIALSIVGATLVTLVAMKIVKTLQENRAWEKTIEECKKDNLNPYDIVDPDRLQLHLALKHDEAIHKKNFLIKFKDTILTAWRSRFGTAYQKALIAADKEKTVSAVLKKAYEEKLAAFKMTKKSNAPEIFRLQKAYDLIRKSRGRSLFQEAVEKAHAEEVNKPHFGNAAETDVLILKKIEAPELQTELEKARTEEALKESLVEKAKRKHAERIALALDLNPKDKEETDKKNVGQHSHLDEGHH